MYYTIVNTPLFDQIDPLGKPADEVGMYYYPKEDLDKELENDGSFILKKPLPSHHFKLYEGKLSITGCDDDY